MPANPEHLVISQESAWGTWVTPAKGFPVLSASYAPGISRIEGRFTGASRGMYQRWPGKKEVSGSIEMPLWGELLGYFIKAAQFGVSTTTPGGGTTSRDHGFNPDDDMAVASLSAQLQFNGSVGINLLGLVIDKLAISVAQGEIATMAMDFLAKDEAKVGGNWADGTSSPAIVASPTYFARTVPPFIFANATLMSGGTPTLTDGFFTLAGASEVAKIDKVEIAVENGFEARYGLGSIVPHSIVPSNRIVTASFDVDLSTIATTWYDALRAGTQAALQLELLSASVIEGTIYRECTITLPLMDLDTADWPEISGDKTAKMRTVSGMAVEDPTSGKEISIKLTDTQTAY